MKSRGARDNKVRAMCSAVRSLPSPPERTFQRIHTLCNEQLLEARRYMLFITKQQCNLDSSSNSQHTPAIVLQH